VQDLIDSPDSLTGAYLSRRTTIPTPAIRRPRTKGRNLTVTVPITFAEAALGAEIKVPTLDDPVTVKIPPGTRSGKTFRVRNRGVPSSTAPADNGSAPASKQSRPGDLLVTVDVAVPSKLSSAEREAVEALAAASTESPRSHLGV